MTIEIHADVICPWSYIAKRRVETALAALSIPAEAIVWRSFELAPAGSHVPEGSAADMIRSFRGAAAEVRIAEIAALGAAEGIVLDLERARPVNTFDAHRLVQLAATAGKAGAMMERLLRAYHSEGENVADAATLAHLGQEAGLDRQAAAAVLAGDAFAGAVRADETLAAERGITGVPMLVIDGAAPVSAVQPIDVLQRLFERSVTPPPA